ncbi:MAG: HEAT repeat domain-containing protein [Acidobacteriota bacterium]|nr:HEAT repeat domain-containing protein [Acidobacteriota bacterium]
MALTLPQICDPSGYGLEEAVESARSFAAAVPGFELRLIRYIQLQCLSTPTSLPKVFRGLEVLAGMLSGADEARLVALLRPFLKSSGPLIASKCVLMMGRHSHGITWLRSAMSETDARVIANLVESLWNRKEPEAEAVFQRALQDSHARVAANAAYGLFLRNSGLWPDAFGKLVGSQNPAFRKSGIWVLKSAGAADAPSKLQPLLCDTDADVRKAAFRALKHLRENKT